MPSKQNPKLVSRFFKFWIVALGLFLVILFAAFTTLETRPVNLPGALSSETETPADAAEPLSVPVPPFDPDSAEYLLTAVPLQGMRQITDAEPAFTLLPPGNVLVSQLIKRDTAPMPVVEGPVVSYRLDDAYAGGENAGAAEGVLGRDKDSTSLVTGPVSVMPYTSDGKFFAYPTAVVTARDASGTELMRTGAVFPVSTEIGCRNCHTGPWKVDGKAGIGQATADNILAVHDRRNATDLTGQAAGGKVVDCRACHSGAGEQPNLSSAIHGFHATMKIQDGEACGKCHPSSESGPTRFYRGFHAMWGLDCTRCHGQMSDHAISLLRYEAENGKKVSRMRMDQLAAEFSADPKAVNPRQPWVNLPQCAGCHDFVTHPDPATASAYNKWTKDESELFSRRYENTGMIRCPTCHGSPHAIYPADGPAGNADNIQPLQYQNAAAPLGKDGNCAVCHTVPMDYFIHHDRVEE